MIETIHEVEMAKLYEMTNEHNSKREETKNKNVEELEQMKHELIKKIEELDNEFENHFNKYEADTDSKATAYKELLLQSQETSIQIAKYTNNINRYKGEHQYWQLKSQQQAYECKERNEKLAFEKAKIMKHYQDLKQKMTRQREEKER